jgi:outer membrane protein assembly factor BamA
MLQFEKWIHVLLFMKLRAVSMFILCLGFTPIFAQTNKDTLLQIRSNYPVKRITYKDVPQEWMGASVQANERKSASLSQVVKSINFMLNQAQTNGYPFAEIWLDSILVDTNGISLQLRLDQGKLILFDSLEFGGTAKIKKQFLFQYLSIKPGEPYNERLIKAADARLSELSYLKVNRPVGIYFYGNKAKPYVYIDERKASSFDGIIGFAPNSQLNNKLVLTGDLNLKLANLAGSGKSLEFGFRSFLNGSQDLQFKFAWPYFFKTRLGLDYAFKLLRFDTTYVDLFNEIGLQYRFIGNNYVKFFFQQQQVNVLAPDTNFVRAFKTLPAFTDVRSSLYGIGLRHAQLDYALNPRKGFVVETDAALGQRKILQNDAIENIRFQNQEGKSYTVYDSITMQSLQYKANLCIGHYLAVSKNWVLFSQARGGVVYNRQLFFNDLYRIGGLKTLKGFDEQSIFADAFSIATLEMRYLFQQNSNFLLFFNGAWYQNTAASVRQSDLPYGFGAGMNLETGAGVLSLYYAVGSEKGNPPQWRSAKLHFGLVNYF